LPVLEHFRKSRVPKITTVGSRITEEWKPQGYSATRHKKTELFVLRIADDGGLVRHVTRRAAA
jgi:hypothetical protein